jgi:cell division protein FtsB
MSTAGKVLVVLVLLLVVVWMFLASGVAEYNRNGGKLLVELQQQILKLEEDVAKTKANVNRLKDQIAMEQETAGKDMVVLHDKRAQIEAMRSEAMEIESRMKIALGDMEAALKNAQLDRDHRVAEKKQMETDLANDQAEVEKLKAEHSRLTAQLNQLRNDFSETYRANKAKVDRLTR